MLYFYRIEVSEGNDVREANQKSAMFVIIGIF